MIYGGALFQSLEILGIAKQEDLAPKICRAILRLFETNKIVKDGSYIRILKIDALDRNNVCVSYALYSSKDEYLKVKGKRDARDIQHHDCRTLNFYAGTFDFNKVDPRKLEEVDEHIYLINFKYRDNIASNILLSTLNADPDRPLRLLAFEYKLLLSSDFKMSVNIIQLNAQVNKFMAMMGHKPPTGYRFIACDVVHKPGAEKKHKNSRFLLKVRLQGPNGNVVTDKSYQLEISLNYNLREKYKALVGSKLDDICMVLALSRDCFHENIEEIIVKILFDNLKVTESEEQSFFEFLEIYKSYNKKKNLDLLEHAKKAAIVPLRAAEEALQKSLKTISDLKEQMCLRVIERLGCSQEQASLYLKETFFPEPMSEDELAIHNKKLVEAFGANSGTVRELKELKEQLHEEFASQLENGITVLEGCREIFKNARDKALTFGFKQEYSSPQSIPTDYIPSSVVYDVKRHCQQWDLTSDKLTEKEVETLEWCDRFDEYDLAELLQWDLEGSLVSSYSYSAIPAEFRVKPERVTVNDPKCKELVEELVEAAMQPPATVHENEQYENDLGEVAHTSEQDVGMTLSNPRV